MATQWKPTAEWEAAEPTLEPVTLDEAKLHLRDSPDIDDPLVAACVSAARRWAEIRSRKWFIRRTFTLSLDGFPIGRGSIVIPPCPLVSIASASYRDGNGTSQPLTGYVIAKRCNPGELRLAYNATGWPTHSVGPECITITGTAGFADDPGGVPEIAKRAMLMVVGHLYENRESVVVGASVAEVPQGAEYLIDQLRTGWVP